MTPPINIDGDSGYGSVTIDGQTVEQITIDGQDVLRTIPDSAVLHWPHNEGSGTLLNETVGTYGNQNGTINGATWVSNSVWWRDQYLDYDGTDDYTETGPWGSFFTDHLSDHTVIVEASVTSGDNGISLGMIEDGTRLYLIGPRDFAGTTQGDWGIAYQDSSANLVQVGTDTLFDDGSRHFFAIAGDATTAASINIYVDDGFVATTTRTSGSPSVQSFNRDVYFGANNDQGSPTNHSNTDIGRIMVTDTALTEPELDDIATKHGFGP